ncbi:hypothetical protein [Neptunomonas sp.]|uniref:hypothetical protein n=1 Tax=Neptunomonas sp. TaxID=1971898 RepID=UPI0035659D0A
MPRKATLADMPQRKRAGAGRTRQYLIDLEPLADIVGKTVTVPNGDEEPEALIYGPTDLASETGDVAKLATFANQVRVWVDRYNESRNPNEPEYQAQLRNFPLKDDNGNVIRGHVKDGKVVNTGDDDDTELYESWVAIVPLTEKARRSRQARAAARKKSAKKKTDKEPVKEPAK